MKNDQVYIVNGLRAVFRAKTQRGIISTYPIAEFTFDDGEKITVKFIPLTGKYSGKDNIDLDIYYEGGVWKLKS